MAVPYDVHAIEARWRGRWEEARLYEVDVHGVAPEDKFYNLAEFPYPSADGLHVGHVFKYCGLDAFGRYQRMRGKVVFQPIGYDAFGINAENYALKTGAHPRTLIARTTANFARQLSSVGIGWDWSRVVDTSQPEYYRWTQWIFLQLFRAGLAYQADAPVVWCPSCLTVLANEQLEGDRCERCTTVTTQRVMRQWFLRITAYADRLLDGLDHLDWSERGKRLQRQWIGRSRGREIEFGDLRVFTTRPDTIMGVTFLAVPSGHSAAGSSRPHPVTGESIPVVEADYVIESYGTGAVMGVPAHDERDRRYAETHGLAVSHAPLLSDREVAAVGRPAARYRLHDWLISRQRYWGSPIPIVHCDDCGPVGVPERELPVELPDLDEFGPSRTGQSPLGRVDTFVAVPCPRCGRPGRRETDVADTFVESSWYFLRYPSTDVEDRPWDEARTARLLPVDFYAGGIEHASRHHLYARFVTMALHDLGHLPFEEPFPKIRLGGMIVYQGAKMSKSRGNVVGPDDYLGDTGADVLRCALMFAAPWEAGGEFRDDAITGIERFFTRVWNVVVDLPDDGDDRIAPSTAESRRAIDRRIAEVEHAIEAMRFNVGLARLMELTGWLEGHGSALDEVELDRARRVLVLLLAPFAPHLAEELWARLGGEFSVHSRPWPAYDAAALLEDEVEMVVQIDGRMRDRVHVPAGVDERGAVDIAVTRPRVQEHLAGRSVTRTVYVPTKVLNFVTQAE